MEYISAKETALKWGITKARVIVLAKKGRIPGAVLCGNQWLIPNNAQKPGDARRKSASSADYSFRFPLYIYHQFTSPAFLDSLSDEEKTLLQGQLSFEACEFEKSNDSLTTLLEQTSNPYIKIGALYYLCCASTTLNKPDAFKLHFQQINELLEKELPYKEELKTIIYDIESLYRGNEFFLENYEVKNSYPYSQDTIPFLNVQAVYCEALSRKGSINQYSSVINALGCMYYEQQGYYLVAQRIHLYTFFNDIWKKESDYFHLKKAIELGIEYDSYFILATTYLYLRDIFNVVLKAYDASVYEKIHDMGLKIQKNIVDFIGTDVISASEILKLSDAEIRLLNYSVMGYSNKTVSEITGIPEYTVRRNYEKLFNYFDVTNKKQLAITFKKLLSDGYR